MAEQQCFESTLIRSPNVSQRARILIGEKLRCNASHPVNLQRRIRMRSEQMAGRDWDDVLVRVGTAVAHFEAGVRRLNFVLVKKFRCVLSELDGEVIGARLET